MMLLPVDDTYHFLPDDILILLVKLRLGVDT